MQIINMTGFSVVYGAGTAIDTLCAQVGYHASILKSSTKPFLQAFGYKAYKRIGIILQQGELPIPVATYIHA